MPAMSERLTLKEAAKYLRVAENTLRWWRTCGTGPRSYRLSGRVYFDLPDLQAWENATTTDVRGGV